MNTGKKLRRGWLKKVHKYYSLLLRIKTRLHCSFKILKHLKCLDTEKYLKQNDNHCNTEHCIGNCGT